MSNDFDLLRAAAPGSASAHPNSDQGGISSGRSSGAVASCAPLSSTCMDMATCGPVSAPSGRITDENNARTQRLQPGNFRASNPCHSLAEHASATCSAGMLPPISGGFQSSPFETGIFQAPQGSPGQDSFGNLPAIDENNINLLTCTGVPGMHMDQRRAMSESGEQQAAHPYHGTVSMPQVLIHSFML